jgi:hypothetical protein
MMSPLRLRAIASSTIPSRSTAIRASRGPSFQVDVSWWTTIGRSSGSRIRRSSFARACWRLSPSSETPPARTPLAISSERLWS